jgi:hypothetical protein
MAQSIRKVKFRAKPTPLTPRESAELEALALMPDKHMGLTDAPYLPRATWIKALALRKSPIQGVLAR